MVSTRKSFSSNIEETNLNKDYVENIISEDNSVIDSKNHLLNQKANEGDGFITFGFNSSVLKSLEKKGYKDPTPIQKAAIPELMKGRDLLGQAQTGTGKTAAFALPIINKLENNTDLSAKVLVMTPTRELATQVADSFKGYSSESSKWCAS